MFVATLALCGCGFDQSGENEKVEEGRNQGLFEVYKIDKDTTVYSTYSNPKFIDGEKEIDLTESLKEKKITIEDVISKMELYTAANDGGSMYYKSKEQDFYLAKCNSLPGNGGIKDIYISDSFDKVFMRCTN